MSKKVVLGLDTSNYTTSIALVSLDGELICDERKLLPVASGSRGIRQSDAIFHHVKHLPELAERVLKTEDHYEIVAVASSTKPRPVVDSYMPVFMASKSYGQTISSLYNIPFYEFSHQEGHIEAGLWSEKLDLKDEFLSIHISGGTTELLKVTAITKGYNIKILGYTSDISAGQLIDRVGTNMGLPFPSGAYLDEKSKSIRSVNFNIPISVNGNTISFSGPETYFSRLINGGNIPHDEIAYATIVCVAKSLEKLIKNIINEHPLDKLLVVGGVASNTYIRNYLVENLKDMTIYFASQKYCTDNAVGIGFLGAKQYLTYKKEG